MRVSVAIGRLGSFGLAAAAALVVIAGVTVESFNPARRGALLVVLLLLHLLRRPRFAFCREFAIYCVFAAYMFVTELWTPDPVLGLNTLLPALDFVFTLILFASLVTYHHRSTALAGILAGFLAGAVTYTVTQGWPFSYPQDFSYNTIAGMYLFGLFTTLAFGWSSGSRLLTLPLALVILMLIAATTSIKTNLGILLGVLAAGLMYFRSFLTVLGRSVVPVIVVAALIVYAVVSNESLLERVQRGFDRVSLGVEILSARGDDSEGEGTSYGDRKYWKDEGLRGWAANPVFGHGVEAFRADYGITSHSTPIDLLYNTGIIGFLLFYSVFASVAWRLLQASARHLGTIRILSFSTLVCYLFITVSGTMHYDGFLAIFIGVTTALLRRQRGQLHVGRDPFAPERPAIGAAPV
jgi:hypothetical protein